MKPYEFLSFTNSLGQVIQPGDRIVVVTGGRGSTVNTYDGTYLGCRLLGLDKCLGPNGESQQKPRFETVVQVKDRNFGYFDKTTGEKTHWNVPNSEGRWYDHARTATLWRNRIFKLG